MAARCSQQQQLAAADATNAARQRCPTAAFANTASFDAGDHCSSMRFLLPWNALQPFDRMQLLKLFRALFQA
jgi:hypothetical protein